MSSFYSTLLVVCAPLGQGSHSAEACSVRQFMEDYDENTKKWAVSFDVKYVRKGREGG